MNTGLSNRDKIHGFLLGILAGIVGLVLLAVLLFQIPAIQERWGWRLDFAMAYLRGVIDPIAPLPTAQAQQSTEVTSFLLPSSTPTQFPTVLPTPTATVISTPVPTLTPTPVPMQNNLLAPKWEKQDVNNCGPTTLAMYLRFYGWKGDQYTIASVVKPNKEDRNVNVEELVAYVNTQVPGLEIQYRVGGDVETLKRLLAGGFPVMIEETLMGEESFWPTDDRWAAHYLLVTGYDDANQIFTTQDSYIKANLTVSYNTLYQNWQSFNRVFVLVYPPDSRSVIQSILGDQWDVQKNRQHALEVAQKESELNSKDAFAWFNQGTNLVYLDKYTQAATAYDKAREAGLPQRMLRYQFGPFFAYFNVNRIDDLLELTDYALKLSPTSEEAMIWRGWAMYRKGDKEEAVKLFKKALETHPGYTDAMYALKFVGQN